MHDHGTHEDRLMAPVLDVDELHRHAGVVLADVRWYLDGRSGRDAFETGHIPEAIFIDLEHDLAAHHRDPGEGRHPFPTVTAFAEAMGRAGIDNGTIVVAYDDTGGMTACRLVVMLRMLGCQAAVLNGGLASWTGALETGVGRTPQPRVFTATAWPTERFAAVDDLLQLGEGTVALDARASQRYSGEVAAIDPRPGHIPGAANAPWEAVLDPHSRRFGDGDQLRRHFAALGVDGAADVVNYCGSGVSACVNMIALEQAGFAPPRLYVASWSGWSADPTRPAKLGNER